MIGRMIPEGWNKYSLGDICVDISYGYTESASFDEVGPKFLRITDIQDYFIKWGEVPYCPITDDEHKKYKLDKGDIVIARTGATTGVTAIFKEDNIDAVYASYLIRYKINKEIANPFYVGYVLKSSLWDNHVNSIIGGSAQPGANAKQFASFKFNLPPLSEQSRIVSILSSLDDKIELNLRMNQTLEAITQAIFKEWFVDFRFPGFNGELVDGLPKGWRKGRLGEIVEIKNGFAFKGDDFIDKGIPIIKIKNVKPNKIILNDLSYVSQSVADKTQEYKIRKDDLLITMSGNRIDGSPDTWVGKVALFMWDGEYLLNQRVSRLVLGESQIYFKYYLGLLLSSNSYQNYFIKNATSSGGQANISPTLVNKTEIVIPNGNHLKLFDESINALFTKIHANNCEIRTLSSIRDLLLPRLMTGKIRVA